MEKAGDQIRIGDISRSTGIAVGRGAQSQVAQGISGDDLAAAFAALHRLIDTRPEDPNVDKLELKDTVHKIETETSKGLEANPAKIERWLKVLLHAAPDILEVTTATLANPLAGLSLAVRAVVERVRNEAK
jgi:hypothetical protein